MQAVSFQPNSFLRNAHIQSILASSPIRRWKFRKQHQDFCARSQETVLACEDGVRLQGFFTPSRSEQAKGLVVLLHGWEGSANSSYLLQVGSSLSDNGYAVFRLNFRDHGQTHHLNEEVFHSCRINEVVDAVAIVAKRYPQWPLSIAGFSLGGNFALRVALRAPQAGFSIQKIVAVCPVIHPPHVLDAMESSPWIYQQYFLLKWRNSLRIKQSHFPLRYQVDALVQNANIREITRRLVEQHSEFSSMDEYLNGYSIAGTSLAALKFPAHILAASDDPIIPIADFEKLAEQSPLLHLHIAQHGGHCGFIKDWSLHSFADDFLLACLNDEIQTNGNAIETALPLEALKNHSIL